MDQLFLGGASLSREAHFTGQLLVPEFREKCERAIDQMKNRLIISCLLSCVAYSVVLFMRRQFESSSISGSLDWVFLLFFAAIPVLANRDRSLTALLIAFIGTVVVELCLTAAIIVWAFPGTI